MMTIIRHQHRHPLIAGILLLLFAVGCQQSPLPQIELSGPTMGTYYKVTIVQPPAQFDSNKTQAAVERILATVVAELSTYEATSELSRFNQRAATDWQPISAPLYTVLAEGQRLAALTGGAFDITIGPLVNLWGFGPMKQPAGYIPTAAQIQSAQARVGWQKLQLRQFPPMARKTHPDMFIDVSALGEGVGADRIAAWLDQQGIQHYLIAVAGALRIHGHNAHGQPWRIAIETPIPEQRLVHRTLSIRHAAVATSGDYRNFFEQQGQRYSHEINPVTGKPIDQQLGSVTVVGDVGMTVDGWATALMILGRERGLQLAEAEGLAAYFIVRDADQQLRGIATSAFARRFQSKTAPAAITPADAQ